MYLFDCVCEIKQIIVEPAGDDHGVLHGVGMTARREGDEEQRQRRTDKHTDRDRGGERACA